MSWILLVIGMAAAQSTAADASLKRIRDALASPSPPPAIDAQQSAEAPARFLVRIEQPRPIELAPPWQPENTVPSYVRTPRLLHHHDFLAMVTPEDFRAGVLYPGPDMLPILEAPFRALAHGIHAFREHRARENVTRELQRFAVQSRHASRQAASRP
jgi:hypothetical protein